MIPDKTTPVGTVETVPLQLHRRTGGNRRLELSLSSKAKGVRLNEETVLELYTPTKKAKKRSIRAFSFAGMWKNRKDIRDGLDYVNRLRDNPRA